MASKKLKECEDGVIQPAVGETSARGFLQTLRKLNSAEVPREAEQLRKHRQTLSEAVNCAHGVVTSVLKEGGG